jgi:hypothetical protein
VNHSTGLNSLIYRSLSLCLPLSLSTSVSLSASVSLATSVSLSASVSLSLYVFIENTQLLVWERGLQSWELSF